MSLSAEARRELEANRDALERIAKTDTPMASRAQAFLDALDSSEDSV